MNVMNNSVRFFTLQWLFIYFSINTIMWCLSHHTHSINKLIFYLCYITTWLRYGNTSHATESVGTRRRSTSLFVDVVSQLHTSHIGTYIDTHHHTPWSSSRRSRSPSIEGRPSIDARREQRDSCTCQGHASVYHIYIIHRQSIFQFKTSAPPPSRMSHTCIDANRTAFLFNHLW